MKKKLTYRMYGFVPYNISEIQKGIQFGHAVVEYANKYGKTKEYQQWAKHDKTFIILNGGPVNNKNHEYGMMKVLDDIKKMGVKVAVFHEPDLNDALSAFVFLVDERAFDRESNSFDIIADFDKVPLNKRLDRIRYAQHYADPGEDILSDYNKWVKRIGGKTNERLRHYLPGYKLA